MRRKQGQVIVSQCQKDLDEVRQFEKDMMIRLNKVWIKKRIGEKKNECNKR